MLLLDGALMLSLIVTAGAALLSRDLFRAVVFFIAFGLLMAVAWVRLQAPDLALAEAAISAGLTGALLLDAVAQLRDPNRPRERVVSWLEGLMCLGLVLALFGAILLRPEATSRLPELLEAAMPASGVSHEVTAVLLNFRGYDTFLEVSVLLITAFISLAIQPLQPEVAPLHQITDPLLDFLVVWLGPLMLMVGVYLFWIGSKHPGGGFQAGALLASAGVLLRLSGVKMAFLNPGPGLRWGLIAGYGVFFLAGISGPLLGWPLFAYGSRYAGALLIVVEAFLTLTIAIALLSLFTAAPPEPNNGS